MNQSEQINELAAALAKAQGAFCNPPRNREVKVRTKLGDTYSFTYATLDAIMDMVRGPLAANGLCLLHSLNTDNEGTVCETRLLHASGQWIATWFPVLVAAEANAQVWGAAITYARRYGLCALLSIAADEDDDGNAACGNHATKAERAQKPAKSNALPARRAEAWRAIEEAESPVALANVAMKTHEDTLLPPETHAELIAEARERMMTFAASTIKKVDTVEAVDKAAKWYAELPMLTDAQQVSLAGSFAMVREGLATQAPEPAGAREIAAPF